MAFGKEIEEIKKILRIASELEMKGNIKEAINQLERAIKIDENDGSLYNRLGDLYIKSNKTKEALQAYQKGISAFHTDGLFRNALALCKKVLRYDPGNVEINFVIARLLVDLDEKADAMMYLFTYIERQMAAGKKNEVMKAMEFMKQLKVSDRNVADKMAQIYQSVGETKKADEVKPITEKEPIVEREKSAEIFQSQTTPEKNLEKYEPSVNKEKSEIANIDIEKLQSDISQLDGIIKEAEKAVVELRKAMRIDEVVIALDKSLSLFSSQQKEAIGALYKSLHINLDNLQKSINELQNISTNNIKAFRELLGELADSLSNINKNQEALIREIERTLDNTSKTFDSVSKKIIVEMNNLVENYRNSTGDVCAKVEETKTFSLSLVKTVGDMKLGLQNLNELLLKFFLAQEAKDKRVWLFVRILTILVGLIVIAIVISIIVR